VKLVVVDTLLLVIVPEATKGRKRKSIPGSWKRNVQKKARVSGLAYLNRSGHNVPAKEFVNINCGCSKACGDLFTFQERETLFREFWGVGDSTKQNIYLRGLIKTKKVNQRRPRNNSKAPRQCSLEYFMRRGKEDIQVCKIYFKDTFLVNNSRIQRACSGEGVAIPEDKRGHKEPANKLDVSEIVTHIKSFPAYVSHYSRAHNPGRQYLNSELTIQKMYQLYKRKCEDDNKIPLKEKMYYHVFSNQFNLHFKPPHQDTCQLCDSLQLKIKHPASEQSKQESQTEKQLHLAKAAQARDSLRTDKQLANEDLYVFTFDLQKALPFPKLTTSTAYYKRNMYVYNLGCHAFNNNVGFMYMWDETKGSRGSQEISSCVTKHLKLNASTNKHIVMYTDCCAGQNRNIKMALSMLQLVEDQTMAVDTIDHKFLVSGHSFLPNDADFGVIESHAKKLQNIFGPECWYDAARNAAKKTPFVVTVMERDEFLSTKNLEDSITNRKTTIEKEPVNWLKMKWIRYRRGSPQSFQFKYTLNNDYPFSTVSLTKGKGKGRPRNANIEQEPLYQRVRPVTKEKKRDMVDLLQYIPPVHHDYFRKLTVSYNDEVDEENLDNVYE
jgi:hypothetical protein